MAGPSLRMAHTQPSMSTTSAAALAANQAREYALFVNDGAVTVYLRLGATAVANQGIRLEANGGSYEISRTQGNLYTGVVDGITATGTATVLVTEGL